MQNNMNRDKSAVLDFQDFDTHKLARALSRLGANYLLFAAADGSTEVGHHNGSSSQQRQQHNILHGMAHGIVKLLQATSHGNCTRDQQRVCQQSAACLQTSQTPWRLQCTSPFMLDPTIHHPWPCVHEFGQAAAGAAAVCAFPRECRQCLCGVPKCHKPLSTGWEEACCRYKQTAR